MLNVENIREKFNKSVFKNLDKENYMKIIKFLLNENCDYIENIISDYLDLFNFEYEEFVEKYNILNQKYNGEFLKLAKEDLELLEEFYY